jgi:hypothetical protein
MTHLTPTSANSVTNTPPPALANPAPYEAVDGSTTTQPWLEFASNEQSVLLTIVEVWFGETWVHPGSVCRVIWFIVTLFTPSNVSICNGSPFCNHNRIFLFIALRTSPEISVKNEPRTQLMQSSPPTGQFGAWLHQAWGYQIIVKNMEVVAISAYRPDRAAVWYMTLIPSEYDRHDVDKNHTYTMSETHTLPTENLSSVLMRTVLRLSLYGTVVVLSTLMIAWFVDEST